MFTITTTTGVFSHQLAIVTRAVPSKPSHPILSNVLCRAEQSGKVTLVGFDLDLGIETRFDADLSASGITALPARLLSDIVAHLPNETLVLQIDDTHALDIRCGSGHYQLQGASPEEFPSFPRVDTDTLSLPLPQLLSGFGLTVFSASTDESKQILNGVCVKALPNGLEFVATDAHRLAYRRTEVQASATGIAIVLPQRSVRELEKLFASQRCDAVALRFDDKQMVFEFPSQTLTTRLLSGRYPDYQLLLPKSFKVTAEANRKTLCSALERISVLADHKCHICKFEFDPKGVLTLSVDAVDKGRGREAVFVDYSGPEFAIAFNCKYLLEGLKSFDCQKVSLNFNGPTDPAIFSPSGGEHHHRYLIMPVSIRSA